MNNKQQNLPGLTDKDIDQLMDPLLSFEERMSAWREKPLSVQARKLQDRWKAALKGPLFFGLVAGVLAFIGLNVAAFSDHWRAEGLATWIICYLLLVAAFGELHRLSALKVDEI